MIKISKLHLEDRVFASGGFASIFKGVYQSKDGLKSVAVKSMKNVDKGGMGERWVTQGRT